jgi:hypothetical protein
MRLPSEDHLREWIRIQLAAEFQACSDLLDIATGIFLKPARPEPDEEVTPLELRNCLGFVAKACRQYRGIIALAEIGLGDVAQSNGRMFLETMLTAEFMMRPTVTLKRNNNPLPDVPDCPLTRLHRTKLYLAHDALSTQKTLQGMAGSGDSRHPDADRVVGLAESYAKECCDEIGPEWTERLKKSKSCSGVNIYELADSLGLAHVYHAFYRPANAGVHGSDASRHIDVTEQPSGALMFTTTSSAKGVAEALVFSSLAMLSILDTVNRRLGLKLDERLCEIAPRIQNMAQQLPGE